MVCIYDLLEQRHNHCLFSFSIISAVPKCIALDVVFMSGIQLMNILLIVRVVLPCSSKVSLGDSLHDLILTFSGVFLVAFRLIDSKFGMDMSSPGRMLDFVTGQLGIRSLCT